MEETKITKGGRNLSIAQVQTPHLTHRCKKTSYSFTYGQSIPQKLVTYTTLHTEWLLTRQAVQLLDKHRAHMGVFVFQRREHCLQNVLDYLKGVRYIGCRRKHQMETLTLVYGIAKGETERYMEQLLSSRCKTLAEIERVKQAAAKDGFHSFRVAISDGLAPDFTKAVQS